MKKIIVAIDGYSSCGKSTMAKALAKYAGYTYIDTGAMYRAVALYGISKKIITKDNIDEVRLKSELDNIHIGFIKSEKQQHTTLNGEDVESKMDGRDITTVVFPNAELKIFVTAAPETRAQRRFDELKEKGDNVIYEDILKQVIERDYRDSHRSESPLTQTADSMLLDNTNLNKEEQFELIKTWFKNAVKE